MFGPTGFKRKKRGKVSLNFADLTWRVFTQLWFVGLIMKSGRYCCGGEVHEIEIPKEI